MDLMLIYKFSMNLENFWSYNQFYFDILLLNKVHLIILSSLQRNISPRGNFLYKYYYYYALVNYYSERMIHAI